MFHNFNLGYGFVKRNLNPNKIIGKDFYKAVNNLFDFIFQYGEIDYYLNGWGKVKLTEKQLDDKRKQKEYIENRLVNFSIHMGFLKVYNTSNDNKKIVYDSKLIKEIIGEERYSDLVERIIYMVVHHLYNNHKKYIKDVYKIYSIVDKYLKSEEYLEVINLNINIWKQL